jgi:hypothetical protein
LQIAASCNKNTANLRRPCNGIKKTSIQVCLGANYMEVQFWTIHGFK